MKETLVVMPSWKQNIQWFKEAIDSVLAQTYQNFEFVIVRTSFEGDEEEMKMLEQYKDRVIICTIPMNANAIMKTYLGCIDRPSKYFATLTSDDLMTPDFLEKHIKALEKNPNHMWSTSWIEKFGDVNGIIQIQPGIDLPTEKRANYINGTSLWRREIWDEAVVKALSLLPSTFKNRVGYPDWDIWIRLLKEGYEYNVIPEPMYKWRIHKGQATQENEKKYHKYLKGLIGENNNVVM